MKKLLVIICISYLPLFAVSQFLPTPIKMDNSLQKIIFNANKNAPLNLPYGDKNIFFTYLPTWKNYYISKKENSKDTTKNFLLDSLVSLLDQFFYADVNNENRIEDSITYLKNQFLFIPNFKPTASKKNYDKNIAIKCIKILSEKSYTLYSIIFSGNQYCNNCEFVVKQTQNVLISINNKNKVIDKLLIGNIEGNDLGRYRMYFYIDEKKIIHLKDFSSDELEDGILQYKKYKILPNGHFIETTKK